MKKRGLSILLAAALTLSLPVGVQAEENFQEGGEMTIGSVSSAGSLDPAGFAISAWTEYAKLCTDGLISFDENGDIVYESAESYEVSDDQLTWTFHLREDGKWSDGSAVTADDFVNTAMRALDPNNQNAIYANMLYFVDGAEAYNKGEGSADDVKVTAVDDYTLEYQLDEPCAYFLKLLTVPVYYPSKAGLATNDDPGWYMDPSKSLGNGAFCLESYTDGVGYTVVKNQYYYQADKVHLDKINMTWIQDATSLLSAFQTGEAQVVSGVPDYVTDTYNEDNGLYIWNMLTSKYILPNLNVEPLNDEKVREAIALALTRADLCSVIGTDYIPSVNYVGEYMLSDLGGEYFKDEQDPLFEEDAAKAQQLLADAGYPNGEGFPKLTYKYPNSEKDGLLAQGIQAQLKSVLNIDVELVGEENGVLETDKADGNFELIRDSWTADFNDPINFLSLFTSDSSSNNNGTNDEAYDAAIENSNKATDETERNQYLHEAQNILVSQNFYVIPCVTQIVYYLFAENLSGITSNDRGEPMFRFAGYTA